MSLIVDSHENQGVTVVTCRGRIVLGDELAAFRARVKELIPQTQQMVLDLAEVSYIDSAGLGTLVGLYLSGKSADCSIKLANLTRRVKSVLQITKLLTVFETYEGESAAVASFQGKAA